MSLFALIKLIRANLTTLLLIPVVMGLLVTILTQDSPQAYTTKAKVYTGIASGYSIESQQNASFNFFAINNAFDNLIDLIKSRSTLEETALRLYALHLIQDEAAPILISIRLAAIVYIGLGFQALGEHHMSDRIDYRHICTWLKLQVVVGLNMRWPHQIETTRIEDD